MFCVASPIQFQKAEEKQNHDFNVTGKSEDSGRIPMGGVGVTSQPVLQREEETDRLVDFIFGAENNKISNPVYIGLHLR